MEDSRAGAGGSADGRQAGTREETAIREARQNAALSHYIAGSLAESEGKPEAAIVEYMRALREADDPPIHLALARNYAALRKAGPALEHARAAAAGAPEHRDTRRLLGELYLAVNRPDSALLVYAQLAADDTTDLEARHAVAGLTATMDPERAVALYESLLERTGPDWDLLFQLSQLTMSLGRVDATIGHLEAMRALEPDNETLVRTLAGMYLQRNDSTRGDASRARELYADLVERSPARADLTLAAAALERDAGRWHEADRLLRGVLTDSLDGETAAAIGDLYFQHALADPSAVPGAIDVLGAIVRAHPGDWRPVWYRGALFFQTGGMDSAVAAFDTVLELDPGNARALDILARAHLSAGNYSGAIKPLQTLIDRRTADADTWSFLGFALDRLGKRDRAVEALRQALVLDSLHLDALSTLALALDGRGDHTDADALYERALAAIDDGRLPRDAGYALLCNNYAYTLAQRSLHLDRALMLAATAVAADSSNSSYHDTYGWVQFKRGEYADALRHIELAIALRERGGDAAGAVLYNHLGEVLQALGRSADATAAWRRAMELDPDAARTPGTPPHPRP